MGICDWLAAFRRRRARRKEGADGNPITDCCPRFGTLAVEHGFVTPDQVKQALTEQIDDNLAGRPHRVIGAIFFEKGLISPGEIDQVLNVMFKGRDDRARDEEAFGAAAAAGPTLEGQGR